MSTVPSRSIEAFRNDEAAMFYMAAYEALQRKWPVPYEALHVPTRLGSTHLLVSGPPDAPPLVLLHAMQATALVWRPNVEALSRHFRVYAIDIIGQGGKSVSSRRVKTRKDFAGWMNELFDALGIRQASLVGNSYGAFLALNQASLAPVRVKRVVLINPAGVFVSILPLFLAMLWRGLLASLPFRAQQPRLDIAMTLGHNVKLGPDEMEWANLVSLAAFAKGVRPNVIFPVVFSTAELRAICKPALLLMGDNDRLYDPSATLKHAQKRMPSLQAQMVPGAHHMAAMANPEEVNDLIIQFLTEGETAK